MKTADPDEDDEDGQPVQPHVPATADLLPASLVPFDSSEAARRLERIADAALLVDLQLQKFDTSTKEWREFAGALAEYGYSVIKGWLITGVAYRMAANHGGGRVSSG